MIFNTLKILMNDYGITQTKISEETNITRPTLLSLIRNENKSIRYDVIESICKLFNIKMSDFLIFSKLDVKLGKIEMYSVDYHDTEDLVIE
ncbi:helix-turn-helix transcriptional regulator, partial [Staphylococcus aureus]